MSDTVIQPIDKLTSSISDFVFLRNAHPPFRSPFFLRARSSFSKRLKASSSSVYSAPRSAPSRGVMLQRATYSIHKRLPGTPCVLFIPIPRAFLYFQLCAEYLERSRVRGVEVGATHGIQLGYTRSGPGRARKGDRWVGGTYLKIEIHN
jgi:hypothetical protein